MQVFHKLDDVPSDFGPTLVSVGNFDGVHRAHAHVLGKIVSKAKSSGTKAVAVTFEPHPTRILRPEAGLKLLTPTPEKLRWLESTGVDAVLLPTLHPSAVLRSGGKALAEARADFVRVKRALARADRGAVFSE